MLKYHLKRGGSDIATTICDNMYVDNGATSIDEAWDIYKVKFLKELQ